MNNVEYIKGFIKTAQDYTNLATGLDDMWKGTAMNYQMLINDLMNTYKKTRDASILPRIAEMQTTVQKLIADNTRPIVNKVAPKVVSPLFDKMQNIFKHTPSTNKVPGILSKIPHKGKLGAGAAVLGAIFAGKKYLESRNETK